MAHTILLVDDTASVLEAIQFALEDEGYHVMCCNRAEALLPLAETTHPRPALILMDILMSGFDGRELANALKRHPLTQEIPIVLMSAHPEMEHAVPQQEGVSFLAKPFSIDELFECVSQHLAP